MGLTIVIYDSNTHIDIAHSLSLTHNIHYFFYIIYNSENKLIFKYAN